MPSLPPLYVYMLDKINRQDAFDSSRKNCQAEMTAIQADPKRAVKQIMLVFLDSVELTNKVFQPNGSTSGVMKVHYSPINMCRNFGASKKEFVVQEPLIWFHVGDACASSLKKDEDDGGEKELDDIFGGTAI